MFFAISLCNARIRPVGKAGLFAVGANSSWILTICLPGIPRGGWTINEGEPPMRDEYSAHDSREPDTFDARASLLRLYRAARHEWKVILLTCGVVLAVVTAYVL